MKPLEIFAGTVLGLFAALGIDLFGMPGLMVITLLLILGTAVRAPVLVLACAIACAAVLALWALATARCTPSPGSTCAIEGPLLVMFAWLVAVLLVGSGATWVLARLRSH